VRPTIAVSRFSIRRVSTFEQIFGQTASHHASAPGRVNLIGDHTDYNGGFVLPLAIPQRTRVSLSRREDRTVRAVSTDPGALGGVREYELGREAPGKGWLDYVQGVTAQCAVAGHVCGGFDLHVESDIPVGSGLSSSAALVVSLLRVLRDAFGHSYDDLRLALIGQSVETDFVGAPVGVMDPMVCSLGDTEHALFIDARALQYSSVSIPAAVELVVISSGIAHRHAAGDYRLRRSECDRAAGLLGVGQLRDLCTTDLPRVAALMPPLDRRARHVLTENERVLATVEAFRAGDLRALRALLYASHASLRDDFEVSTPEIDLLVELGRRDGAIVGARLTGGGFGGSVVMLARSGEGAAAGRRIIASYRKQTGQPGRLLVPPFEEQVG